MKKVILATTVLFFTIVAAAQDRLEYSRVLTLDTVSKGDIYDKAMVWCSKMFNDSKDAINVKERESGLISGKAVYLSLYKTQGKRDSVFGSVFLHYSFDWLMEIKKGKLRYSASNILYNYSGVDYPVFISDNPPITILFQAKTKTKTEWELSKSYLISNIDQIVSSLYTEIIQSKKDF
ncbi:MAG: DUF4468 domain-containing protein [Taibaiella sp.]|nr:DUF4468 domain-containing protein [Taibaiella sp.]